MRLAEKHADKGIKLPGACEGQCVCATCHVYINDKFTKKLKEPSDKEEDTLDSAWGMKDKFFISLFLHTFELNLLFSSIFRFFLSTFSNSGYFQIFL